MNVSIGNNFTSYKSALSSIEKDRIIENLNRLSLESLHGLNDVATQTDSFLLSAMFDEICIADQKKSKNKNNQCDSFVSNETKTSIKKFHDYDDHYDDDDESNGAIKVGNEKLLGTETIKSFAIGESNCDRFLEGKNSYPIILTNRSRKSSLNSNRIDFERSQQSETKHSKQQQQQQQQRKQTNHFQRKDRLPQAICNLILDDKAIPFESIASSTSTTSTKSTSTSTPSIVIGSNRISTKREKSSPSAIFTTESINRKGNLFHGSRKRAKSSISLNQQIDLDRIGSNHSRTINGHQIDREHLVDYYSDNNYSNKNQINTGRKQIKPIRPKSRLGRF